MREVATNKCISLNITKVDCIGIDVSTTGDKEEFYEDYFQIISVLYKYHQLNTTHPQVPWWNKRTNMERRFVVLIGSLGVVALSLGVGLVLVARGQRNSV